MSQLNWDDFRFFLNLVRAGNPMRAATVMRVDHTTVRRRVAALERTLDAKLFDRQKDQYHLTAAGEKLFESAEIVEGIVLGASEEVSGSDVELAGPVRIGAADGFGSYYLAPKLAELCNRHDGLRVTLIAKSRQFDLSKREADIACVIDRPPHSRHFIRKLVDVSLYLYASDEYLRTAPRIRSPADLDAHRFIGYMRDFDYYPELDPSSLAYTKLATPEFASSNLVAQLRATLAGGGLCLLPRYMIRGETGLVRILENDIKVVRHLWMIIHRDLRAVKRYRVVCDYILESVARDADLFT